MLLSGVSMPIASHVYAALKSRDLTIEEMGELARLVGHAGGRASLSGQGFDMAVGDGFATVTLATAASAVRIGVPSW